MPTAVNQLHFPRGEAEDYQISLMITAQSFIPLNERLREALVETYAQAAKQYLMAQGLSAEDTDARSKWVMKELQKYDRMADPWLPAKGPQSLNIF